jgi:serine O-acetyltransferase
MRPVAETLQRVAQVLYGIDISYEADIAPGVTIRHGVGIVVGNRAKICRDVVLFHGVTVGKRLSGSKERPDGMPVIEEGVLVGAGAVVLGPVTVGAGSIIGANTVVTKDVPPGSIVTGPPPVYRTGAFLRSDLG